MRRMLLSIIAVAILTGAALGLLFPVGISHASSSYSVYVYPGGPEKYTGRDMKTTHAGLKITMADFKALVDDLVKSLDQFKVPQKEKDELLAILGPLNKDIVTA